VASLDAAWRPGDCSLGGRTIVGRCNRGPRPCGILDSRGGSHPPPNRRRSPEAPFRRFAEGSPVRRHGCRRRCAVLRRAGRSMSSTCDRPDKVTHDRCHVSLFLANRPGQAQLRSDGFLDKYSQQVGPPPSRSYAEPRRPSEEAKCRSRGAGPACPCQDAGLGRGIFSALFFQCGFEHCAMRFRERSDEAGAGAMHGGPARDPAMGPRRGGRLNRGTFKVPPRSCAHRAARWLEMEISSGRRKPQASTSHSAGRGLLVHHDVHFPTEHSGAQGRAGPSRWCPFVLKTSGTDTHRSC